jgi:hypothetical protein
LVDFCGGGVVFSAIFSSIEVVWEVLVRPGKGECGGEVVLVVDYFWSCRIQDAVGDASRVPRSQIKPNF